MPYQPRRRIERLSPLQVRGWLRCVVLHSAWRAVREHFLEAFKLEKAAYRHASHGWTAVIGVIMAKERRDGCAKPRGACQTALCAAGPRHKAKLVIRASVRPLPTAATFEPLQDLKGFLESSPRA